MDWLNYHHLYYFSVIVQEGGVTRAARKLHLTHSTLSAQLRALEDHFGAALFERRGKRLVLTSFGSEAAAYATDIFRLGRELNDAAHGRGTSTRNALRVGVVSGVPKTLAHRLLSPALKATDSTLLLKQDEPNRLLEQLASGRLHVLLVNEIPTTMPPGVKVHIHALGETDIVFFASAELARRAKTAFPKKLGDVPFVLPAIDTPLRRRLDAWFAKHRLEVRIKAEVDDAGLLRALGSGGHGVFPVRVAVRAEVEDLHGLREVGRCEGLREPYFALTTERRVRHPGVAAIIDGARAGLNETGPRASR